MALRDIHFKSYYNKADIDIAKEIRHMTSEEKILFRKTHPYRILSTTCRFPG